MRMRRILGLLICTALVFSLSSAQSANAASAEEEVLQVALNWAKAFNNSDFELMSSLYWHSPKISEVGPAPGYPFLYQGWDLLENDWRSNLKWPKGTYNIIVHNSQVNMLKDDVAVITSYQNITVNPPAEKDVTVVQIRQTLVVQKINGKWVIVHHHSSQFPL